MKYRIEFDSIGKIKVPGDKYWGASTQRSNKYFDIFIQYLLKNIELKIAVDNAFHAKGYIFK